VIALKNLSKSYEDRGKIIKAVDGLDLEVKKGEFISIVGPSGCGKTTLLSLVSGLIKPTEGTVSVDAVDIWTLPEREMALLRNKKIGFVFQFASLIPTLNATENVMLPAAFGDNRREDASNRARELMDLVGLSDRVDSYPSQLSGGEQRRVAIARALMNSPGIILADEPTGDLDEVTEREVMKLFVKINKELGTTFLLVTHNTELTKQTDRKLTMKHGGFVTDEKC
jgi:putative ABC transport system ATP-binding protein/lipoprotein-releasing system ATP-binding protein